MEYHMEDFPTTKRVGRNLRPITLAWPLPCSRSHMACTWNPARGVSVVHHGVDTRTPRISQLPYPSSKGNMEVALTKVTMHQARAAQNDVQLLNCDIWLSRITDPCTHVPPQIIYNGVGCL